MLLLGSNSSDAIVYHICGTMAKPVLWDRIMLTIWPDMWPAPNRRNANLVGRVMHQVVARPTYGTGNGTDMGLATT